MATIASLKPGHDGVAALIRDGTLEFSYEAEKDSFPRYGGLQAVHFIDFLRSVAEFPDVICLSGWRRHGAGYFGVGPDSVNVRAVQLFGKDVTYYSSTHERSHIWTSYALSPFDNRQPVYCLVWEGSIGAFYEVDAQLGIRKYPPVLADPGNKYCFLFALADPTHPDEKGLLRHQNAGKLMALAAYGSNATPSAREQRVIDWIMAKDDGIVQRHSKAELADSGYYNIGVDTAEFRNLARKFSDALFDRFYSFAKEHLTKKYPLLIGGGCGLNCDWNRKWLDSGVFTDVFVPPCVNDTGSAIGTAVDAQVYFTGKGKLTWNVYSGQPFDDSGLQGLASASPFNPQHIARELAAGKVVALAQGRCEIGPRALGNRSLLAAPFSPLMAKRLNRIKDREPYRPIAPVVLECAADALFDLGRPSPYMLFFSKVTDPRLGAVTHVDGSARHQSVSDQQNPTLAAILREFGAIAGVPVLCNTSLNFKDCGFINNVGDLIRYCTSSGIDLAVVGHNVITFTELP